MAILSHSDVIKSILFSLKVFKTISCNILGTSALQAIWRHGTCSDRNISVRTRRKQKQK